MVLDAGVRATEIKWVLVESISHIVLAWDRIRNVTVASLRLADKIASPGSKIVLRIDLVGPTEPS